MNQAQRAQYGKTLFDCMTSKTTMQPLIEIEPDITIEDAYYISREYLSLRLAKNHEKVVGKKIGVTSDAVPATRCSRCLAFMSRTLVF